MRLILASTSRYRRALLEAAGVEFTAASPPFNEDHSRTLTPEAMVVAFARGKAESLAAPDAVVIGADQIPALEDRILTKPGGRQAAIEQLQLLAGRTHRLLTAVAVHARGRTESALVVHQMRMRVLTREQIERYVDRDEPFDCAGAYKVEAAGSLLFEAMDGSDHTAIVGLPLTALTTLLAQFGQPLL